MTVDTEPVVNPDRVVETQARCAHAACSCLVPPGSEYCSDACRMAPAGGSCGCNHPACAQSGQMT